MNALVHHPQIPRAAAPVILTYFLAEWLLPVALPVAFVLSGLAIATVSVTLATQRVIAVAPATLLATAGIALALDGIVTDHATHLSLDTAFKVLGAAAIFLIGTGTKMPALLRVLLIGAGSIALLGYFSLISGPNGPLALAGAVTLTSYPVLISVLVLGLVLPSVTAAADADEVSV